MMKLFKTLLFLMGAVAAGALAAEFFAGPGSDEQIARVELPERKPLPKPPVKPAPVPQNTVKTPEPGTSAPPSASTGGFVTDDAQTGQPENGVAGQPENSVRVQEQAVEQSEPAYPADQRQGINDLVQENALKQEESLPPGTSIAQDKPANPAPDEQQTAGLPETRQESTAAQPPDGEPETTLRSQTPGFPVPNPGRRVSLEDKIGQMLIFGFQGSSPEQKFPQAVARQLANGTLGGVIFLRYNLPDRDAARRLMDYFHQETDGMKLPPLFVLDQEGGRVQRLGGNVGVKRWPTPASIGRGSLERARAEYAEMADTVRKWGFNVNLGPVVDVNVNLENPIIGKLGRSFSGDPKTVVNFSRAFIEAHRKRNIITALKHFPGHGSSEKDSHLGFTDISRTWRPETELAPYQALIRSEGSDMTMVMMGHLYLDRFHNGDAKKHPATLSKTVIDRLLRKNPEMGNYDGVIISDDMQMGAIRKHYKTFDAAIRAIKAGVDLLIVSNSAKPRINLPESYIAAISEAARKDPVLRQRIDKSYQRILRLKSRLARGSGADAGRSTERHNFKLPVKPASAPDKASASGNFNRAELPGKLEAFFATVPR